MDPIIFEIGPIFGYGPFPLRWYGLLYAIGIFLLIQIVKREANWRKLPLTDDDVFNVAMFTFLGAIVGARAYYVIFNWDIYFGPHARDSAFAIWNGGLAIHGGIITGTLCLYFYGKYKKIPFLVMGDLGAPPLILAQAIGRIGNLMNGDAHGTPTDLPWGLVFPPQSPAGREFPGTPLHPVMIYESILNFIAFWVLLRLGRMGFRPGLVGFMYLIAYANIRFFASFFRADDLYMKIADTPPEGMQLSPIIRACPRDLSTTCLSAPHSISIFGLLLAMGFIIGLKLYLKEESDTEPGDRKK